MRRYRKQMINREWLKKNKDGVWVAYGKIKTQAEADHANRLNAQLYGPDPLPPATVARRPFMAPAFTAEQSNLPAMWAEATK